MPSKKRTKIRVNFKGVDKDVSRRTGGARVPEGDYIVKILDGEYKENEDKGTSGIAWSCQILKPEAYKGKKTTGYTSLSKDALWSLRNLVNAALGKNLAGKVVDLDIEKLYGKVVGAAIEDNEYEKNGKTRVNSRISTFFPKGEAQLADADDDEEEDDDDDEEDDETEEEEEDSDLEDVEVDEL